MKKIVIIFFYFLWTFAGPLKVSAQATATPTSTPFLLCCTQASPWIRPTVTVCSGVAVDTKKARVYVTDNGAISTPGDGLVWALRYDGSPDTSFGTNGSVSLAGPFWVAVGSGSYEGVYVASRDDGAGVTKLDVNGNELWTRNPSPGSGWRGVAVDDWGNVYASAGPGQILVWDNNGVQKSPDFPGTLNAPTGMWTSGLNVFVADTLNNRVVQYVQSGVNTYSYSLAQAVTLGFAPYGITRDIPGNFYIAGESVGYRVFDSQLNPLTQFCAFASADEISLDETGEIYVASNGENTVEKMSACFPQTLPAYHGFNPPDSGECFIYPSPAKGDHATLSYKMTESGRIELKVWNERAELVADVTDQKSAGVQVTPFSISGLGTGVYFYSLTQTYDSGKAEKIKPHKFVVIH